MTIHHHLPIFHQLCALNNEYDRVDRIDENLCSIINLAASGSDKAVKLQDLPLKDVGEHT